MRNTCTSKCDDTVRVRVSIRKCSSYTWFKLHLSPLPPLLSLSERSASAPDSSVSWQSKNHSSLHLSLPLSRITHSIHKVRQGESEVRFKDEAQIEMHKQYTAVCSTLWERSREKKHFLSLHFWSAAGDAFLFSWSGWITSRLIRSYIFTCGRSVSTSSSSSHLSKYRAMCLGWAHVTWMCERERERTKVRSNTFYLLLSFFSLSPLCTPHTLSHFESSVSCIYSFK